MLLAQNNNEQLAIQYFSNREYRKAADLFKEIYEKRNDSYYYYYYLRCLNELQDFKAAEKLVKTQQKRNPKTQRYRVDLGYVYVLQNETKKANEEYADAIKALPADANAVRELANAFVSYRLNDLAAETYVKGRKLLNDELLFSRELANVYLQSGQYDKVIAEMFLLVEKQPDKINVAQNTFQNMLVEDEDNKKSELLYNSLLKKVQQNPANTTYAQLLIWYSMQKKYFDEALRQAISIDKREKLDGAAIFNMAAVFTNNEDYAAALKAYDYLMKKGEEGVYYTRSWFRTLDVKYKQLMSTYPVDRSAALALEKEFDNMFLVEPIDPDEISVVLNYVRLKAFVLEKADQAAAFLQKTMQLPSIRNKEKALLKIELADILLFANDVWEATLLYSQVEKDFQNDTIGQLAKYKNAKLSFYIGEFAWAKDQLDVLRAATTKLIANDAMYFSLVISDNEEDEEDFDFEDSTYVDNKLLRLYARADFLMYKNMDDEALRTLDTLERARFIHSLQDDVLYKKAQLKIKQQKYDEADSLLTHLLDVFPQELIADDALYLQAQLQEKYLHNTVKAMDCYQRLITDYSGSLYVDEARKSFRRLRGDLVN